MNIVNETMIMNEKKYYYGKQWKIFLVYLYHIK